MSQERWKFTLRRNLAICALIVLAGGAALLGWWRGYGENADRQDQVERYKNHQPRRPIDTSGFALINKLLPPLPAKASLEDFANCWRGCGRRFLAEHEKLSEEYRAMGKHTPETLTEDYFRRVTLLNYEGEANKASEVLKEFRSFLEGHPHLSEQYLFTVIYLQGVTALRCGENDNCVLCRGESSCILPISPAAVHANPAGSRLAIQHFSEYLVRFPDDLEVRWLLNIAHMTVGEYPEKVDPSHRIALEGFQRSEFGIGRFRDVGHRVGLNRLNQAGGAIMDDFDNDDLLDLVFTSTDPTKPMAFYRNRGDGTFEERTQQAGLLQQLGGLNCVQTDYNNDGLLDIFVVRGAWLKTPVRPSLLRNNGDGTFTDVTVHAGLSEPINSIAAAWADFDNDGFLDLFICCENQPNRLYRNRGNGTFEEVAARAGVAGHGTCCKGAAWIDFDNDGYPDLFVTNLYGTATLYRNNRNGTFTDVTSAMGIDGPFHGFSCWAFDYDNDGWPDIFATCYERTMEDVLNGLMGQPHKMHSNKLYRNLQGKGFQDVTKEAGLDLVFAAMGSNFADFDNDGYLDFYLGTGDPQLSMLIPNRMMRNLGGQRFVEITGSSGTGHLQKGHGVACGDWDRDGNIDIAIELGGTVPGDQYHNVLFQNPGQRNNWLNVKLTGQKTNRAAIGARIKVVTAGDKPLTIYRYVSSGSSFGANPLEQHIGLGQASRIACLEVYWPTSGTTQVFRDINVNQALSITEFDKEYRQRRWKQISLPE